MRSGSNEDQQGSEAGLMIGVGVALGAGMGAAMGVAIGNIAVGVGMGIAIGVAIGAVLDQRGKEASGSPPQLVNFNNYGNTQALDDAFGDKWIYIGREVPEFGLPASALGNPFTLEEYSRDEAVEKYREWLVTALAATDAASKNIQDALMAINEDSVLVCWCAPQACHGDVVRAAWARSHEAKKP